MKVLILGGTGAMGSSLTPILAEGGNAVYVTSRSPRKSEKENVHYVQGNAHDTSFLNELLSTHFDSIVDFMVYSTEEFQKRKDLLLNSTDQYIFLSSSRVYAASDMPLTERSPRLLDTTKDEAYLQTDEYALAKARQENLLRESDSSNWTIVRPYITYSPARLQLGVYEKELWMYRALQGKTIIFPKEIASKYTTLTLGEDVAAGIANLVGNAKAYGKAFHITAPTPILWEEALRIYREGFREHGLELKISLVENAEEIYPFTNRYQVHYDRCYDRKFDNSQITQFVGEGFHFTPPEIGLKQCLTAFLDKPSFLKIPWPAQKYMDNLTHEKTGYSPILPKKEKLMLAAYRYIPNRMMGKLKRCLKKRMLNR